MISWRAELYHRGIKGEAFFLVLIILYKKQEGLKQTHYTHYFSPKEDDYKIHSTNTIIKIRQPNAPLNSSFPFDTIQFKGLDAIFFKCKTERLTVRANKKVIILIVLIQLGGCVSQAGGPAVDGAGTGKRADIIAHLHWEGSLGRVDDRGHDHEPPLPLAVRRDGAIAAPVNHKHAGANMSRIVSQGVVLQVGGPDPGVAYVGLDEPPAAPVQRLPVVPGSGVQPPEIQIQVRNERLSAGVVPLAVLRVPQLESLGGKISGRKTPGFRPRIEITKTIAVPYSICSLLVHR
jgi:hypothetical protein